MSEINEILETLLDAGVSLGANKKGEFSTEKNYLAKQDHNLAEALQALHAATIAALPEKKRPEPLIEQNPDDYVAYRGMIGGFNECVDQMKAAIDELYDIKGGK